ncbi:MAG: amidase family protein [Rhodobacterales bacterium]|jgi:amidase
MENIVLTSATNQANKIRKKTLKSSDLLKMHFDQIDRFNPEINAVIWEDRETALKCAKKLDEDADKGNWHGPLHGVPVTVKESFDIKGAPSTWGHPHLKNHSAKLDSDAVFRLREAGAIVFGKTNVPLDLAEWQTFNDVYGTTNNPWDLTRAPGGSSGGSAAALATGMTALEVGSDIGSSIRNPAHYCGIFGLKPTYNVVSTKGHGPEGWHIGADISVAGPLARSAIDLKLAFDIIKGPNSFSAPAWKLSVPNDTRKNLNEFNIGLNLSDAESPIDNGYMEVLLAFVERLKAAGANIIINHKPNIDTKKHFTLYLNLLGAALAGRTSEKTYLEQMAGIEALENNKIMRVSGNRYKGLGITHREQLNLDNERHINRLAFDEYFSKVDILITPVASSAAFNHNQVGPRYSRFLKINGENQPENTQLFWSGYSGVVGLPSVVGPVGTVNHLPVGYQAIAGYGRDYTALAFATAVEKEIGGFNVPPLCS